MTAKMFPRASGWRRVLWISLCAGLATTAVVAMLGFLLDGPDGARSALLGGAAVIVFSALSLVLVDIADRLIPSQTITAFMLGFALKLAALAVLLSSVSAPDWIVPGWTVGAAAVVVLAWQAGEITAFLQMRTPLHPG